MSDDPLELAAAGGILFPRWLEPGVRWVGICPLMYTHAVVVGRPEDARHGYADRWCYHDFAAALIAMAHWIDNPSAPEPEGWHRHPTSGRRRNPLGAEWVNP